MDIVLNVCEILKIRFVVGIFSMIFNVFEVIG